jgi:Domain of unknown function (DUF4129)
MVTSLGGPVDITREAAQQAARAELADPAYREAEPSPFERAVEWLYDRLGELLSRASEATLGGPFGLVVLALLAVVVIVVIRWRIGPVGRASAAPQALFARRLRTAAEHRARADDHAAAGRWAEAVRERLRAIVRDLEERGLLEPRAGRTADEAADEGGAALPDCAAELRAAARVFDEVWYGGRSATAATDKRLRALDEQVRASRPTAAGAAR